ncbi:COP9 signalosome complex subunit 8-like isoform X1 [Oncorhynchus masou masou]|uniref:COP9 signalosome complex subunit 8-like isoform X1 n=1 Tax=Oncorhynchus masou masou TaxID=90313 RepID=UPI003183AFFF
MPAVVIMDENYDKLLEQCQTQELEAPGGIATPQVYAQLLALYLLHNDMNNARYLWKRIPQAIKSGNPELTAVWAVGQRIWQRDFPGIYSAIAAHQWSENILPAMDALQETTRRRAYGLVAQAYTSITAEDFAAFVGYSVEEAVKVAKTIKRYDETGSREDHHRKGRPRVTSAAEDKFIRVNCASDCSPNKCFTEFK